MPPAPPKRKAKKMPISISDIGCRNREVAPAASIHDIAKAENLSYKSAKRLYNRHLARLHEIFGVPPVG